MSPNFLSLSPYKTEFLPIGFSQPFTELSNPAIHLPNVVTFSTVNTARNLGVISDSKLTLSQPISAVFFNHIPLS